MPKYEKVQMVFLGIIIASLLFGYGVYALIEGNITLVGRGNPPIGTFVTFNGTEARLLSTIFIGAGMWLFADYFLGKRQVFKLSKKLSWSGAITLLFGMCSLVFILLKPIMQQGAP